MKVKLNIETYFWNKESNFLFDYDSMSECYQGPIIVESNGKLVRNGRSALFFSPNLEKIFPSKQWTRTFEFEIHKENIIMSNINSCNEKAYVAIKHTFDRNMKNNYPRGYSGLKLKEGDVLKFGKVSLICKEINLISSGESNFSKMKEKTIGDNFPDENDCNNPDLNIHGSSSKSKLILSQNKQLKISKSCLCRFCLCEDNEDDNPLIAPCHCAGTMKYIHIDCLKNWLKSKISIKTSNNFISYSFKQLECELCLTPVPMKFKFRSKMHDLINMTLPDCSHIIFEHLVKEDLEKTIYLVMFKDKKSLKVGRSNDSDFRLSDISISRHHADLYETPGGVYLEDNESKFGSLYLMECKLNFIFCKTIGIQIGKHFFLMRMSRSFWSSLCCYK